MSEWLAAIAPAVGDHLWQSTAFAALAALLALLLRKNQARARYWIWLAALMKFLLPFSLLIGLGGLLPRPQSASAAAPTAYTAMETMDTISEPFAAAALPVAPTHIARNTMPEALASLWLCGLVVVFAIWCTRWRRVAAIVREAAEPQAGREVEMLRRLERNAGIRPVRFLLSQSPMEPGMFGVLRPVLLWPEGMSARLSGAQLEAILAHELCHVRRRDNLFAMAQMVAETVFWFYPLVWWMGRRMVEERERACDEEVLGEGRSAETYAESILKICEFCLESPLACVSGITGANLKRRIVQIMSSHFGQNLSLGKKTILAAAGLAAVAAPVALGIIRMTPIYGQILSDTGPLPSFEVATIKPSDPMNSHENISFDGDRLNATLTTETLIERAYGIRDFQVVGGPKWLDSARYDIVAKSDENWDSSKLTPDQQDALADRQMLRLQSLLVSRFQLKVHTTKKVMPIFALVVAKGGPKLLAPKQGEPHRLYSPRPGRLACYSASMPEFADELLDAGVSRIVLDKTGLTGRYDFSLRWTPDDAPDNGDLKASAPSMFTAIQEQLGLKLVPSKGPVEVLVIDHIVKPSEN